MKMDRAAVAFVKVAIDLGSEGAENFVIEYSLDVIMLLNIALVCLMALLSYKGKWRGFRNQLNGMTGFNSRLCFL